MTAETRETSALIGSDKVEGTAVCGSDGSKIGSIERILLEKRSGRVSDAVLSFGGFLGVGHDHYPLPWAKLSYNTSLGGYQTDITKDQLSGSPRYDNAETWDWDDRKRAQGVNEYYGVEWGAC